MKREIYSISDQYSKVTGLRTNNISAFSGEDFYHKVLNEIFYTAIQNNSKLILDLDSGRGYAPSFVDESLGNLVYDYTKSLVDKHLELLSNKNPSWYDFFNDSKNKWEKRRIDNQPPEITEQHAPWYRFVEGKFIKKEWLTR